MDGIKWEFYVDGQGEHRCRTVAANGNVLMVSGEGYKDERDAENCARLHGWEDPDSEATPDSDDAPE